MTKLKTWLIQGSDTSVSILSTKKPTIKKIKMKGLAGTNIIAEKEFEYETETSENCIIESPKNK